jgi:hypothetical protein
LDLVALAAETGCLLQGSWPMASCQLLGSVDCVLAVCASEDDWLGCLRLAHVFPVACCCCLLLLLSLLLQVLLL